MKVLENNVSSNNNRSEKIPFVKNNVRDKNVETKNENVARSYARSKQPRLRWTDDLHRRFLCAVAKLGGEDRATPKMILHAMGVEGVTVSHVKSHLQMHRTMKQTILIQEAIDAAKRSGKDTELIAKLPELVKTTSRPVSRRQTRLQTIKTLLVKNALVRHFSDDHPQQPPQLELVDLAYHNNSNYDGDITIAHIPSENGKRAHDYMVFNDLFRNPSLSPSTIQGNEEKGKEKIIYEEASNKLEKFYKEVMNKSTNNVLDPKLRLQMVCSPVTFPPNNHNNNISLKLTL